MPGSDLGLGQCTEEVKSLPSQSLHSRERRQAVNRGANKIILESDKSEAKPRLKPTPGSQGWNPFRKCKVPSKPPSKRKFGRK